MAPVLLTFPPLSPGHKADRRRNPFGAVSLTGKPNGEEEEEE